jgi:hypothetical protein
MPLSRVPSSFTGTTRLASPAANTVAITTSSTERLRITSAGDLFVGGTSAPVLGYEKLGVIGSAAFRSVESTVLGLWNTTNAGLIQFYTEGGGTGAGSLQAAGGALTLLGGTSLSLTATGANPLIFNTNNAERMRIAASGTVGINQAPITRQFAVTQNLAADYVGEFTQLSATGNGLVASVNSSGTGAVFFSGYSISASATRFSVFTNGNVVNLNNSYGAISDVKLKENIVDATPKLEDLCKVKVRQYNLKSDPNHKQIGVVAQELEEVFAGLVETVADKDRKGNDLGTTTKQVKYSVFVPMLIKAMQEQQAIITSLTSRIESLENQ